MTINQITSLVKAPNAVANDSVLVTIDAVRPRNAHAPTGRGLRTRPAMVERKMERSCHAWRETTAGLGTRNRTITPTATEITRGMSFAPCGLGLGLGLGSWVGLEEEEARIGECLGLEGKKKKGEEKVEKEDEEDRRVEGGREGREREMDGGDLKKRDLLERD